MARVVVTLNGSVWEQMFNAEVETLNVCRNYMAQVGGFQERFFDNRLSSLKMLSARVAGGFCDDVLR